MPSTLSTDDLKRLYTWVDGIDLSRPKRNIARDFSDGVLVAEARTRPIEHGIRILQYLLTYSTPPELAFQTVGPLRATLQQNIPPQRRGMLVLW